MPPKKETTTPPRKINGWIPKMMGLGKGDFVLDMAIFDSHLVKFLGCNS